MHTHAYRSLYNNVVPPSRLNAGVDFHLFKEGIEPKWEDPRCSQGGKWVVPIAKANKGQLDTMWLNTVRRKTAEGTRTFAPLHPPTPPSPHVYAPLPASFPCSHICASPFAHDELRAKEAEPARMPFARSKS